MARPLKPLVRGGGYYPSARWTPLVYPGGYTTANGGGVEPEPVEKTVSGAIVHITDAIAAPLKALTVNVEPVQAAGTPSPENPLPISGWTAATVTRTGRNLFNWDRTQGTPNPSDGSNATSPRVMDISHYYVGLRPDNYYYPSNIAEYSVINGAITVLGRNNGYGIAFPVSVRPSTTYTLHGTASANPHLGVGYYDSSWHYLGTNGNTTDTLTFTTPATAAYAVVNLRSTSTTVATTWTNVQLELGSTASAYEPYQGNTYTIQLGDTVYGGTLDVTQGKMLVDRTSVDLGTITWETHASLPNVFTGNGANLTKWEDLTRLQVADAICSKYILTTSSVGGVDAIDFSIAMGADGSTKIYVHDSTASDLSDFRTKISGVQLVYKLKKPVEITLTPTQIETLLGTNNIWSDAGDVSVTYMAESG